MLPSEGSILHHAPRVETMSRQEEYLPKNETTEAHHHHIDTFYVKRGVQLLSVEVLQFKCSNPDTDKTLQAIIKETADRLKKKECSYCLWKSCSSNAATQTPTRLSRLSSK